MFLGSINADIRSILSGLIKEREGLPVYIGCSGNFTIERTLTKLGVNQIHGNDVSLYSCYVGSYLARQSLPVRIVAEPYAWLEQYMAPGINAIAALLLCNEMFKYEGREERYHARMRAAYRDSFSQLHEQTAAKVQKALDGVKLNSFALGDVVEFLERAPDDIAAISFPPTYKGGYEKLYLTMDSVFDWNRPTYDLFDDKRLDALVEVMTSKKSWAILRDAPIPQLEGHLCGMVQTGLRKKPVLVYSNSQTARVVLPRPKVQELHTPRLDKGDIITADSRLSIARITQAQMNLLRSQYLSAGIIPASAMLNLAVLVDDEVIGGLALTRSNFPWCHAYMMTDFAVRPTSYRRLSKLVLAAALSTETEVVMEQSLGAQIKTVGTTAFTERAVSMKYRGLFELHSRKEGRLNYLAPTGQWSLKEALAWWIKKHSKG